MRLLDVIEAEVCCYYDKPLAVLESRSHDNATTAIRHLLWAVAMFAGYGSTHLGRVYGYDHTTILAGVAKAKVKSPADFEFLHSDLSSWDSGVDDAQPASPSATALGGRRGYHHGVPCIIDAEVAGMLHIRIDGALWIVAKHEVCGVGL